MEAQQTDFLIVTALEEERDALLNKLSGVRKLPPETDDVRVYYSATVPTKFSDGSSGTYTVVVLPLLGMGRVEAATATSDAVRRWKPRFVLVVGIAGGVKRNKVNLGDLIVADQVVDYELQKLTTEGQEVRLRSHNADPRLLGAAKNLEGTRWRRTRTDRPNGGDPKRHIGPIASGDKVIEDGAALAKLCNLVPKVVGVEMEAAGVATAAFEAADQPGVLVIRAASDLADSKKNSAAVRRWRKYACEIAASYAVHLLKSGPVPPDPTARHTQPIPIEPIPKADPKRFAIALAHLANDDGHEVERLIVESIRDISGVQILRVDRTISPDGPIPEESEGSGHDSARALLRESSAQVLIWGTVLLHGGRKAPRLYWTTAESGVRSRQPYLPENFQLPEIFWEDLVEILRVVVITQSAELLGRRGQHVSAALAPFATKLQNLVLAEESKGWTTAARAQVKFLCAMAFATLGSQNSDLKQLALAIQYYREVSTHWELTKAPEQWAASRNSLGVALGMLGSLEVSPNSLKEAIAIFRDALNRVELHSLPLQRASLQSNLGSALLKLGERNSGTEELQQAIQAYGEAARVWNRDRFPLDWATVQSNLAYALQILGTRNSVPSTLLGAIAANRAALQEWKRDLVPMYWASAQSNLGNALKSLGELQPGIEALEQAAAAFRLALGERVLERDPILWGEAQNNLATVLLLVADRSGDKKGLEETVQALREALKVRTLESTPLAFASSKNNLGNALTRVGEYKNDISCFEESITAIGAALQVWTRETMPARWSVAQQNLGDALAALGKRQRSSARLQEAEAAYRQALTERDRSLQPLLWAATQAALARAYQTAAEWESGTEPLHKAVSHYRQALDVYRAKPAAFLEAGTAFNLGNSLRLLGERTADADLIIEALENHAKACQTTLPFTPYWSFRAARAAEEDLNLLRGSFSAGIYETARARYSWILSLLSKHDNHGIDLRPFFKCVVAGTSGGTAPDFAAAPNKGDRVQDGTVVWENGGRFSFCQQCNEYLVGPESLG